MENPYNPTQAEAPYRPCRIREAQEYPALRRFHYLMLLMGIVSLIISGIGLSNIEENVATVLRAQPRRISKLERTSIEDTLTKNLTFVHGSFTAASILIIICALAVFHHPLLATATAFAVYLVATLFILWLVLVADADRINLPGLPIKFIVLTMLVIAMIIAARFERDFEWRLRNPKAR